MKFVKGMGWVSTNGRVITTEKESSGVSAVVGIYQENKALRELVWALVVHGRTTETIDAFRDYEFIYGSVNREGPPPAGLSPT